jgi:preprotein translocase subunit SecD
MKIGIRTWILIVLIFLSVLAIRPSFQSGAIVKYVDKDSELFIQGLRTGESIKSVNGQEITNRNDYSELVSKLVFNENGSKFELETNKGSYTILTNQTPPITVDNSPKTNIKTGLDLRGGARALVQPDVEITDNELSDLILISRNRFNVYGLSDVKINGASDLEGNKFMLVEVAGATPGDLRDLVSQQGKFEAKIGNKTVFSGGKSDISDVCRNKAECAGITDCSQTQDGYACTFRFTLYLTADAAKRHSEITGALGLDETGRYLSEKLELYVDEKNVDSLFIGADLRGLETTQISIQGPGTGTTRQEAYNDAVENMNKLQTVLITGSLPYKLNIVKLDTISPTLGDEFVYWIWIAGLVSAGVVSLIIFLRYRNIKLSLAVLGTSLSEVMVILGVASVINWNLDLPSIAGILATIGTGVDQQIVILDEAKSGASLNVKERMKRALFIVFSVYATALVSLLPLYWAGAGLFKGFAITTIIGITAGVFITRPAFSEIINRIQH